MDHVLAKTASLQFNPFVGFANDRRHELVCLVGAGAAASMLLWWLRPEPRGFEWPQVHKSPDKDLFRYVPPPTVRRAQHGYYNFPPPFPNGWMFAGPSHAVRKREVLPLNLWGRDLVLFRGDDLKVGVLGAYCPHMGTHVGYGGYVKGNNVVCPYHEWAFDTDGVLQEIPYIEGGGERICEMKGNHMRKYPVIERYGMIFVWMHADEAEPSHFWILDPIEKLGLVPRTRVVLGTFHMHVQEPAHNSCDWYHFKTVHSVLGQHWFSRWKLIQPEIWSPPSRMKLAKSCDDDGSPITDDELVITDQSMKSLHILGFKVPQWIVDRLMKVQVRFCGCMIGSITMKLPFVGTYYGIVQMTPQAVFNCHVEIWGFSEPWHFPRFFAWILTMAQSRTLFQDKEVWEHRTHTPLRNRVKGEYNWGQFDKWVEQLYSKSSTTWDHQDLRW